jgi:hypothetical protein
MVSLKEIADKLTTRRYWITFTGDSITSCEWVHPNWRDIVIYVLQNEMTTYLKGDWKTAEWGLKGFNFAYDGSTTRDIWEKTDDILSINPDLVIGLMGGNDPIVGLNLEETKLNIKKIVSKVIKNGSKIVWSNTTPPYNSAYIERYRPYAEEVMSLEERDGLQKLDMFNLYSQFPLERFFTFKSEEIAIEGIKEGDPDWWHPNQLGNAYIAKVILHEVFAVEYDPEKYISDTLNGEKLPRY